MVSFDDNISLVYHIYGLHLVELAKYDKDDIIQEGLCGLWSACKTYNESKNIKFSTYAAKCIINQIRMYTKKVRRKQSHISLCELIHVGDEELLLEDTLSSNDNLEDYISYLNLLNQIQAVLFTYNKKHQDIIIYLIDEHSLKETVLMSGVSLSLVNKIWSSFKQRLLYYMQNDKNVRLVRGLSGTVAKTIAQHYGVSERTIWRWKANNDPRLNKYMV